MNPKHILTPLLLASLPLATAAHAQSQNCGPRSALIAELSDKYGEVSHGAGMANAQNLVEVWSSEDGSWTILSTNAHGTSCVIASGKNWTENPEYETAFDPKA